MSSVPGSFSFSQAASTVSTTSTSCTSKLSNWFSSVKVSKPKLDCCNTPSRTSPGSPPGDDEAGTPVSRRRVSVVDAFDFGNIAAKEIAALRPAFDRLAAAVDGLFQDFEPPPPTILD